MDRETKIILEYIFGGTAILFACLWFFIDVLPLLIQLPSIEEPLEILLPMFLSPFFFLMIGFLIPTAVFEELKKQTETKQVQTQSQQQQQQQIITVNVPPSQTTQEPSDFAFCTECGFKNLGTAKFCKKCGVKIE